MKKCSFRKGGLFLNRLIPFAIYVPWYRTTIENERVDMPSARILIVEDERQTVDTLRDVFEQYGYETEVALNRQVALAILQERKMDVAILSATAKDNADIGFLHEVRKLCADLLIIMVSDQKLKRMESSSVKAGASIFLTKPIDVSNILQTIGNLLEYRVKVAAASVSSPKGQKVRPKNKK